LIDFFSILLLGHLSSVKILVEYGADVSISNLNGTTSLMRAAQQGYSKIVEFLVREGGDVNR